MIRLERMNPVTCATCGQQATRSEVEVRYADGGRSVVFETHAQSLHDEEFHSALQRINEFHAAVHALQSELRTSIPLKLSSGWMTAIDLGTVTPSACEVRTQIIPAATIKAFSLESEVQLEPQSLIGSTAADILAALTAAAEVKVLEMGERFQRGDF